MARLPREIARNARTKRGCALVAIPNKTRIIFFIFFYFFMKNWPLYLAIFLILSAGGTMTYRHFKQRGIRNNNAGNLRITSIPWKGKLSKSDNTDGEFEQFISAEYGIRALYRDVRGDVFNKGMNTVRKLINSYAPPSENNTKRYIEVVAKAIGKSPDAPIVQSDFFPMLKAIIKHENGVQPYSDELIKSAMELA